MKLVSKTDSRQAIPHGATGAMKVGTLLALLAIIVFASILLSSLPFLLFFFWKPNIAQHAA